MPVDRSITRRSRRVCTVRAPPRKAAILTASDYLVRRMRGWRRWLGSRARGLIRSFEIWLFLRLAERREILGVPVTVACEESEQVFDKIEAAFELLVFYGKRTLAGLQKDTNGVWVYDVTPGIGQWERRLRLVLVDEDYVRA